MAKTTQPKLGGSEAAAAESRVTQGGSYVVDPASGALTRVAGMAPEERRLSPEPQPNRIVVATADADTPGEAAAPVTTSAEM